MITRANVFEQARSVPVPEVATRYGLELQKRGKYYFAHCLFHPDRNPSLVVYLHRWRCYGCQARGDGIDLAARLLNLRPYEAARQICLDFGLSMDTPFTPEEKRKAAEAARKRKEEREATEFFNYLVNETHDWLCAYYRAINRILDRFGPFVWSELVHGQLVIEHYLDCLETGDFETKLKVVEQLAE